MAEQRLPSTLCVYARRTRRSMESWLGSREAAPLFSDVDFLRRTGTSTNARRRRTQQTVHTTCTRVHGHRRMSITLAVRRRRRRRRVIKPTPSPIPLASPFRPYQLPFADQASLYRAAHVRSADRAIEQTPNDQTRSRVFLGKFSSYVVAWPRSTGLRVSSELGGLMAWSRRCDGSVKLISYARRELFAPKLLFFLGSKYI